MSSFPSNSTSTTSPSISFDLIKAILESAYFWLTFFSTVVPIIAIILTRPRCEPGIPEEYIDDETGKYVQIFPLALKFVGNPLFPKVKLFDYKKGSIYEIAGYEFGSYDTILPSGSFDDEDKNDHRQVSIREKSILKQKKISTLRITLESEATDYRMKTRTQIYHDRIEVVNHNNHEIRKLAVCVTSPPNVQSLMNNPKVYDVYPEGNSWIIRINKIPGKVLQNPGKETISL